MKFKIIVALIAFVSLTSCMVLPTERSIETLNEIIHSEGERVLLDYAFSPNGDRLALFDNSGVYIYNLITTQKTSFLEFDNSDYTTIRSGAVAFSPDGKQLAISGKFDETEITIWDIESQRSVITIQGLPDKHFITEIEFSPNAESLIVRNTNTEVGYCEGYILDKMTLHNIKNNKRIFEIEKCSIAPPIQFRFSSDETVFFYSGSMSNTHSVYFINSNTGQVISEKHLDSEKSGIFYDISPDGKIHLIRKGESVKTTTYFLDSKSNEVLSHVEGEIVLFYKENSFVVNSYTPNTEWSFWEGGKFKCTYSGVRLSRAPKTSANREVFMAMKSDKEFQIWRVSTCEIIDELQFYK